MHGVAAVMVKDYAKQRNRELRRMRPRTRTEGDTGWLRDLRQDMANQGLSDAVMGSASPDGPLVH